MGREDERRSVPPQLVAAAALIALGLGFWGFALYLPSDSLFDHFYRALQLFILSGDVSGDLPWQLQVARLGAPALTVAAAAIALAAMSQNRIDRWRARRRRGHVVVCGLGRRGAPAALALSRADHHVVGIELDPASGGIGACRRAGIPVIVGDARDPAVLAQAGVPAADHLVLVTSALEFGGEVALAAVGLMSDLDRPPLTIHLEVDHPQLAALLRATTMTEHRAPSWRLEALDLSGVGARAMLDEQPPWQSTTDPAQVLVAGASPLGVALATQLARRWLYLGGAAGGLTVTVLDPDPTAAQRFPARLHGVELRVMAALPVAQRTGGHTPRLSLAGPSVTAAYVCMTDEAAALASSLALLSQLPGIPVIVRLEKALSLAEILRRDAPRLRVVSLDQSVLTPEVLLDSTVERIARALHDSYRRTAVESDPSAVPWDRLPDQLKASNRAQAADVAEKIRVTGHVLVPDDGEPPDVFTDDEVQVLGRLEHERWTLERRAAGWTPGPRDAAAKTTPYLVPWDVLDEDVREIDRRFVRALPEVLADAGLVLRRTGRSDQPTGIGDAVLKSPRRDGAQHASMSP